MRKIVCLICISFIFFLGACNKDFTNVKKNDAQDSKPAKKYRTVSKNPNYLLKILASKKSPLTSEESPDICWSIFPDNKKASNDSYEDGPIIFYINDHKIIKQPPIKFGEHILKLGDIKLKKGKSYTLRVKLFMEGKNNSTTEIAADTSVIKY